MCDAETGHKGKATCNTRGGGTHISFFMQPFAMFLRCAVLASSSACDRGVKAALHRAAPHALHSSTATSPSPGTAGPAPRGNETRGEGCRCEGLTGSTRPRCEGGASALSTPPAAWAARTGKGRRGGSTASWSVWPPGKENGVRSASFSPLSSCAACFAGWSLRPRGVKPAGLMKGLRDFVKRWRPRNWSTNGVVVVEFEEKFASSSTSAQGILGAWP